MLDHPAAAHDGPQGGAETAIVIPETTAMPRREASPALAGRVGDNRRVTVISACIPVPVPGVYIRQPVIAAASLDKEGGDHSRA